MKKMRFRSLTVTLAVAFLTLIAAVLLIANSLQMYFNFRVQRDIITDRQQLIAQKAANTVKNFIQGKFDILKTAASLSDMTVSSLQEQKLILEKLLGREPAFRQLILFDAQKQELIRDSRLSNLLSLKLTEKVKGMLFSKTARKKIYISSVYIDEITSEPMVIMAVPVTDVLGDFKGTLLTEVNLKFMWDLVGSIRVGATGVAYVVDRSGNLIAFGDISRVLKGENLVHIEEVSEFVNGTKFNLIGRLEISKGIQDIYVASIYVPLGMPDWAVVVELPVQEAYRSVIASFELTMWTMLLSFALALVAGAYLARKITKPVINLRNAVVEIGRGRMDTRIKVASQDEIGQLAASFNQMIEDLNRTTVSRDALVEEVAERKQAENALHEAVERLERTNKELKDFIYIASHDLREPLRKVAAFGRLLESSLTGKIASDDLENLKFMIDGASRMTQMVEGLLSYSQVSTSRHGFAPVSLNEVINDLRNIELSVLLRDTDTILDVPEDLPSVQADPIQIRQLLQNLIANGIKYQKKGNTPRIFIRARATPGKMVRIEVTDNGIGIKSEYYSVLFTMFKRLHSCDEYEGTGVGLAVCKKIVERHGGQIGVESKFGEGSTFWFTLPAAKSMVCTTAG